MLKAQNCGLSDKSAFMMKEAIQKNPKLNIEHLDLSGNPFEKKGITDLLSFITSLKSLQHLNLSNCIQNEKDKSSLKHVLSEIIKCKKVNFLNISNNKGANLCVKELNSLLTTSTISHFDISGLELSDKNADSIKEALIKRFQQDFNLNQNLKSLIWKNNLSSKKSKEI